jgi:hypothetical protein
MKHSVSRRKAKPVFETLPLMANVTVLPSTNSIDLMGDVPGVREDKAFPSGPRRRLDDFRPTVLELEQITRYWYREFWKIQLNQIYHRTTGSSEIGLESYAEKRLDWLGNVIGLKRFRCVLEEIDAEIREQVGEKDYAAVIGTDK